MHRILAPEPLCTADAVTAHRPAQRHHGEHQESRGEHAEHHHERCVDSCSGDQPDGRHRDEVRHHAPLSSETVTRPVTPAGHADEVTIAPALPATRRTELPQRMPPPRLEATTDLLEHLRAPNVSRPRVDAGLAGGLRAWLEDEVAALAPRPRRGRLVVHDALATGALATVSEGAGAGRPRVVAGRSSERIAGRIAERIARMIFRLVVTDGAPLHPFEDALAALAVCEGGPELLEAVRLLPSPARAALRIAAHTCAATTAAQWRRAPAAWLPRTGERRRVALGGGDVVLRATADLVLGRPAARTASVCLVRVRTDGATTSAVGDVRALRFLALLETVCSGAAPLRVASYRPASGTLVCEEVTDTFLTEAVGDVAAALARP